MIAQIKPRCNRGSGRKNLPSTWEHDGITYQLIQQFPDRLVWDCSICKPFRKLLGRIEYNKAQGNWRVINVGRDPWNSRDIFVTWNDALLQLHYLVSERERQARIEAQR